MITLISYNTNIRISFCNYIKYKKLKIPYTKFQNYIKLSPVTYFMINLLEKKKKSKKNFNVIMYGKH